MSMHPEEILSDRATIDIHGADLGVRISPTVLENVCKKMIKIVLYCLPHATAGTIYSVGQIPELRVLRIASGYRRGQSDQITWQTTGTSDYDFPGKVWEDYRDRPGRILEAMAWCVEKQRSWTAEAPEHNCRSMRKQLEGRVADDYHHMEPVLVKKADLWDAAPPPSAYPEDSGGKLLWQDSQYATVAVIKIHFLPETIGMGDRSTRIIKELSKSLGTEMLSLHSRQLALEQEKRLMQERQRTCKSLAHEFRHLTAKLGFAYRVVNNEIAYLRNCWEETIKHHIPKQSRKETILQELNAFLRNLIPERSPLAKGGEIAKLAHYQNELMEACLLPQQNEMWLRYKIRPLWRSILATAQLQSSTRDQIEDLLIRLEESFRSVHDTKLKNMVGTIPDDLKQRWVELAYREIDKYTNGSIEDYISLLNTLNMYIPHKRYSSRNLTYLKTLIELIPEIENKVNCHLRSLGNSTDHTPQPLPPTPSRI